VRSFTDAEILVSERRRLEQPLVVLVWVGVVLFSLAEQAEREQQSLFFLIAGTVAAGIKLQAVSRGKELLLRPLMINLGVLLATAVVILALLLRASSPVIAIAHYAILIQLCKLFERARNRDYAQVLALSMLTVMTSCLYPVGNELWFAAVVAAYLGLACYTGMVLTLKRGLDRAVRASLPTEAGPLPAHKVAWNVRRDWPSRALRWKLVPILLVMSAVGALFFVVAPRTRLEGGTSPRAEKNSASTGFSDTVRLGDAKIVYLSDHVAMNVRFRTAPDGRSQAPGPLYLRGHAMETYRLNQWSQRKAGPDQQVSPNQDLRPDGEPPAPGRLRMESNMVRSMLPTLFGLHPARSAWADAGALWVSPAGEWRVLSRREGAGEWFSYVVESSLTQDANFDEPPSPADTEQTIDRQVREEAATWCRDLLARRAALTGRPDEQAAHRNQLNLVIAQRIAQKLASGFKYSLDLSRCNPDDDGVHDFLFSMKQGHCEYFASAMTVMCRALDVPARLATGFRLDDLGAPGEWVAVRDRDAHAWTEVYDRARGWVAYDATPSGPPQPVARPWWSFLSHGWEDADQFWYQKVIRFSVQDQADLMRKAKDWFGGAYGAVSDIPARLWRDLLDLFSRGDIDRAVVELVIALGVVAGVAEALILLHLVRRKTRVRRWLRRVTGERWMQVRFLARLLRLLERHGVTSRPGMTLLETVTLAADELHIPAQRAGGLVRLYYRLRWGALDILPEEVRAAEQTVADLERALRHARRAGGKNV
jgi:transglutaminase-like putative cysteine protease